MIRFIKIENGEIPQPNVTVIRDGRISQKPDGNRMQVAVGKGEIPQPNVTTNQAERIYGIRTWAEDG